MNTITNFFVHPKRSLFRIDRAAAVFVVVFILIMVSGCGRTRIVLSDVSSVQREKEAGPKNAEDSQNAEISGTVNSSQKEADPETGCTAQKERTVFSSGSGIAVHVCGAVERPGVYYLPEGARASQAVQAAGGMTTEADSEWVNLAKPVIDGEQIRIPTREDTEGLKSQNNVSALFGAEFGTADRTDQAAVNLNTADEARLMTLPGIGAARARAIISYREKNGGFSSIEQIREISGIKTAVYEQIRDLICV